MPITPDPDDQRRLRWLRDDLASCLGEIGVILRRTSGAHVGPYAARVSVDLLPPSPEWPLGPLRPEADPDRARHGPACITCTWADGTTLVYDWQDEGLQREAETSVG